jgi:16S rRNA (uracil1498-N3)-methyltransferase
VSGLPRIFVTPERVEGEEVRFGEEELRHIRTVLRLHAGDSLLATDGTGMEYRLRLAGSDDGLRGVVEGREEPARESPLCVTLVQAVPKKELMDLVVQKAVELGASGIRPVISARTVVQLSRERGKKKHLRWERIAAAAVAQSGRTKKPLLGEVCSWQDFLREGLEADLKVMLCEGEERSLRKAMDMERTPSTILLAVGPEGGWEREEIAAARAEGFVTAGFGPRTLRTETAGLAALSVLQFRFGDLGGEKGQSRVLGKEFQAL